MCRRENGMWRFEVGSICMRISVAFKYIVCLLSNALLEMTHNKIIHCMLFTLD